MWEKLNRAFPSLYRLRNGMKARVTGIVFIGEMDGTPVFWDIDGNFIDIKKSFHPRPPEQYDLVELIQDVTGQQRMEKKHG